jgi:hypothetical protein
MNDLFVPLLIFAQVIAIDIRISWYDPALGGVNCDGSCATMAAGHDPRDWYGRALACPPEFPIGSIWRLPAIYPGLPAKDWICLDRGGMVVMDGNGTAIVDLLTPYPVRTGLARAVVYYDELSLFNPAHSLDGLAVPAGVR